MGNRIRHRHHWAPWPGCTPPCAVEHGWLVLDIGWDQADALARDFGQAGTLYWLAGEPVRLRMQAPRPDDAADDMFTDWTG